jgi:hypothetical protein
MSYCQPLRREAPPAALLWGVQASTQCSAGHPAVVMAHLRQQLNISWEPRQQQLALQYTHLTRQYIQCMQLSSTHSNISSSRDMLPPLLMRGGYSLRSWTRALGLQGRVWRRCSRSMYRQVACIRSHIVQGASKIDLIAWCCVLECQHVPTEGRHGLHLHVWQKITL